MNKDDKDFIYLKDEFAKTSVAKIKKEIFAGAQIREV